jgi:putative addiction module component (TIGR02574 family)
MKKMPLAEVLKLNISDRILLVENVWDSIAAAPHAVKVTPSQKEELDRRLKTFRKNPSAGSPWSKVKKRILKHG